MVISSDADASAVLDPSELMILLMYASHLVYGTSTRYNYKSLTRVRSPLCGEVARALEGETDVSESAKRAAESVLSRVALPIDL